MYTYPIETQKGIHMTQTQYKLEDFKVGQKVKVLVDLGISRFNQVGTIVEIDYVNPSLRVKLEVAIKSDYALFDQWYRADEILPVIKTHTERLEEINRLEAEIQTLVAELKNLD
jgi:hypothetical protein